MSQLVEKVAALAGATTAEVVRVARSGGTTAADWAIAHAIEAVTGRLAADIMWGPTHVPGTETAPAPTNPEATYDPQVRVYAEDTAPAGPDSGPDRITPHHPGDDEPAEDTDTASDDQAEVEAFAAAVYSDLDDLLLHTRRSTGRLVRSWTTTAQARRELRALLAARDRLPAPAAPAAAAA